MFTKTDTQLAQNTRGPRYRTPDLPGTADIDAAHILPGARKHKIVPKNFPVTPIFVRPDDTKQFVSKLNFERSTDKKILHRQMRDRLNQDAIEYQENLLKKQDKLRSLLETEEHCFKEELKAQAAKEMQLKKEELKNKTEAEKRQESENQELEVAAKRMQQYLARLPEVRNTFAKISTLDTKHCNLAQIQEKTVQKLTEKQEEELWHKMALEKLQQETKQEEEILKKKASSRFTVASDLKRQIQEKLAMQELEMKEKEEERKRLQEIMESLKHESLSEMQKKQEKRQKLKAELDEQLEQIRKRIAEHEIDDANMDIDFPSANQDVECEKNKLKLSSKALHEELLIYMESLREFREQQARRDAEIDKAIREVAREEEEKRRRVKLEQQEARKRGLQEVMEIRAKQLREKEEQKEREKQQRELEDKMLEERLKAEDSLIMDKSRSRRLNAIRYAEELKAQKAQQEILRQKEREQMELMYKHDLEKDDEYRGMIKKMLETHQLPSPYGCKIQIDKLLKGDNRKT